MTKHTDCIITFQKNNGDIIIRPRFGTYGLQIGDETSMGWKVINIHYEYNGNYYVYSDYIKILRKNLIEQKKLNKKIIQYFRRKKQQFLRFLIRHLEKRQVDFYYRSY